MNKRVIALRELIQARRSNLDASMAPVVEDAAMPSSVSTEGYRTMDDQDSARVSGISTASEDGVDISEIPTEDIHSEEIAESIPEINPIDESNSSSILESTSSASEMEPIMEQESSYVLGDSSSVSAPSKRRRKKQV